MLGGIGQAFQYIQEYTGLVSPGILAVFLMGLFWKKTTSKGAYRWRSDVNPICPIPKTDASIYAVHGSDALYPTVHYRCDCLYKS